MKKSLLFSLIAGVSLFCSGQLQAAIPMSYYSSLDGKCGKALKDAIFNLTSNNVKMLSYGSGNNATWWGFYVTDYILDGSKRQVVDRYSNDVRYFGNRGSSVSGMNIEHSFPKSWWGGSSNNAYKDLYNLMPCEQKINSSKSNYGMGVVTNPTTDNGCTKVGAGAQGFKLWEPADKWKGDFARGYLYMATTYQDFTWTGEALNSLTNSDWQDFKEWAYTLYIKWAKADPVNQEEIDRNDAVAQIQGNRNPYIDFPNLMEYVWGDSINVPLNLKTTVKATQATTVDPDQEKIIYDESFAGSNGGCTASGTPGIWVVDNTYGWKASGFISGACKEADASIETPELDLTSYAEAEMVFEHAANKFNSGTPEDYFSVGVRIDGGDIEYLKSGINWPEGTSWSYISSGNVDLNPYVGHKVKIVFRYTSTGTSAGTWEIKNLKVTASGVNTVGSIIAEPEPDTDAPVEYYSIDGRRLNPEAARGLVIRRQGHIVSKVILR